MKIGLVHKRLESDAARSGSSIALILTLRRPSNSFFDVRNGVGIGSGCEHENYFRLFQFAQNFHRAHVVAVLRMADNDGILQDRKLNRIHCTFLGKTVVMIERHLN